MARRTTWGAMMAVNGGMMSQNSIDHEVSEILALFDAPPSSKSLTRLFYGTFAWGTKHEGGLIQLSFAKAICDVSAVSKNFVRKKVEMNVLQQVLNWEYDFQEIV
jgi:hypothetical protein